MLSETRINGVESEVESGRERGGDKAKQRGEEEKENLDTGEVIKEGVER